MKVLVSDPLSEEGLKVLKERGIKFDLKPKLPPDELKKIIGEYQGLIIRSGTKVTAEVINACRDLKVIGRAGVGVDNVDINAATKKGILVMNTPGGNTISTAEHTVSMLLALNRNIPQANISLKNGEWNRKKFMGVELSGKILGIIGLGRIGIEVAKRANSFGMKIIAFDPFLSFEKAQQHKVRLVELVELFSQSDYITVHAPLSAETRHLLGKEQFEMMKKGVKILNCARGGIVDEKALYAAIDKGIVSGVALDVFEKEPAKDNPLVQLGCVVATPHLGASTEEAQVNVAVEIAHQVADVLQNTGIHNAVNFPSIAGETSKILNPYINLAEKLGSLQVQITSGHITKLNIKYGGDIVNYALEPVTIALIKGLLTPILQESINYVNAQVIAKERGIVVSETKVLETEQFANLISVEIETNKGKSFVAGTLFTKSTPRIVRINGFYTDIIPSGYILITHNLDRPGTVGKIGTILGDNNVNIAAMNFGRTSPGGKSIIVLNIDHNLTNEVVSQIKAIDNILDVKLVEL